MIRAVVVINNNGKPRLLKFYEYTREDRQQEIAKECYNLVTKRGDELCKFVECENLFEEETLVVYRKYATLFFIFCVDKAESELGIIDLIQVFVETLDKYFENVCELDIIFHMDKVNYILDEIVVGGLVMEPNNADILAALAATKREEYGYRPSALPQMSRIMPASR